MDRLEMDWVEEIGRQLKSKIQWLEFSAMGKPGENYVGLLTRVRVGYGTSKEDVKTMDVVHKTMLKEHENQVVNTCFRGLFRKEAEMYKNVFKIYDELIKEGTLSFKLWPDCYFISPSDTLVMEDLKATGFDLADNLTCLGEECIKLVMEALGRFHALSTVATSRGLLDPANFNPPFGLFFTEKGFGQQYVTSGINNVINYVLASWGKEWEQVAQKLVKINGTILSDVMKLDEEETRIRVINHGDVWSRNLFFKNGQNGRPIDVRMLDFQSPHYGSYGFDLVVTLSLGLSLDQRLSLTRSLLQIYCRSFKSVLESLATDPSLAPSVDEAEAEIQRLQVFSMSCILSSLPLVYYEGEAAVAFDDYMDLGEHKTSTNQIFSENARLTAVLKENLNYFISQHVL